MELQSNKSVNGTSYSLNSKPTRCFRCSVQLGLKILLIVLLIIIPFIGGYLVRRAVDNATLSQGESRSNRPLALDETALEDMLADMSAENIENTLRYE